MPVLMPATYFQLVERFPLTKIRDDTHLAEASEVLNEALALIQDEGVEAYVDVLSDLIEAYETVRFPYVEVSAGEMLNELIRANSLTQDAIAESAGIDPADLAVVIAGNRPPTPDEVDRLSRVLHVTPSVFGDQFSPQPPAAGIIAKP